MKDNFSGQSASYAAARPGYPDTLIAFLLNEAAARDAALDCGTGNGQLAIKLAPHFTTVFATDMSEAQLARAPQAANIIYRREAAESSSFINGQFDLVTVAQALHWFDFDAFYREVYRVLRADGLFAAIGYGLPRISPEIDRVIDHFYQDITGPYWDPERRYVDEEYATIPFPFEEIPTPRIEDRQVWSLARLHTFLSSWSAVQHYLKATGNDPMAAIRDELSRAWGDEALREVRFPIFLRAGRKQP